MCVRTVMFDRMRYFIFDVLKKCNYVERELSVLDWFIAAFLFAFSHFCKFFVMF